MADRGVRALLIGSGALLLVGGASCAVIFADNDALAAGILGLFLIGLAIASLVGAGILALMPRLRAGIGIILFLVGTTLEFAVFTNFLGLGALLGGGLVVAAFLGLVLVSAGIGGIIRR